MCILGIELLARTVLGLLPYRLIYIFSLYLFVHSPGALEPGLFANKSVILFSVLPFFSEVEDFGKGPNCAIFSPRKNDEFGSFPKLQNRLRTPPPFRSLFSVVLPSVIDHTSGHVIAKFKILRSRSFNASVCFSSLLIKGRIFVSWFLFFPPKPTLYLFLMRYFPHSLRFIIDH